MTGRGADTLARPVVRSPYKAGAARQSLVLFGNRVTIESARHVRGVPIRKTVQLIATLRESPPGFLGSVTVSTPFS